MKKLRFFIGVLAVVGIMLFLLTITLVTALAGLFQAQANAAQATANLVGQCITGFMVIVAIIAGAGIGYGVYAGRTVLAARREGAQKHISAPNPLWHTTPHYQQLEKFPLSTLPAHDEFLLTESEGEEELTNFLLTHWR